MEHMKCLKCKKIMRRITDNFHGFDVSAWKCAKCGDIVYDSDAIQPILSYNKLKAAGGVTSRVGVLGTSKILRFPKDVERLYGIARGQRIEFELEPGAIRLRVNPN